MLAVFGGENVRGRWASGGRNSYLRPLIMVVTFVGFVGGWTHAFFGVDSLFAAGALAAVVATWFTFLPSFLFIFAGAPFIESTHGELRLTAPLTGITAAVVGVIGQLAVFFVWHLLWPHGSSAAPFAGALDWPSLALGAAAVVALFRYKIGVIPLILGCGAAGLVLHSVLPL